MATGLSDSRYLMILASAGSGKTHQLVNRVISLVANGADPGELVALTFTRKAAGEFADAVLLRLASAVLDPGKAELLRSELGLPDADFPSLLEQVANALDRWSLGTIDAFFSKIVRSFQQELGITSGEFELIEGPKARLLANGLMEQTLLGSRSSGRDDEYFMAFRRATMGREDVQVLAPLRKFIETWHNAYRENPHLEWGPSGVDKADVEEWERGKSDFASQIRAGIDRIGFVQARQQPAFEKMLASLEGHTIGSGRVSEEGSSLWDSLMEDMAAGRKGEMELKYYKPFTVPETVAQALRGMVRLCVRCELAAAAKRTKAIREVVRSYDDLAESQLRSKGLLGFADVKALMGRWAHGEDARLRREAVDFRLDAKYRHWLLDEFQDTSRADWAGISPLVDEVVFSEDGSLFVVGDKKQAIYAWRGGDVTLFDDLRTQYRGRMPEPLRMPVSYRSRPEVLALVNRICGDHATILRTFGKVADRWEWEPHDAAPGLRNPNQSGESQVVAVENWEARKQRTLEILRNCQVGERDLSCAVLLRQNDKAGEMADFLRSHGFDVVLDGTSRPAVDSPVGCLIWQTLRWLANPADSMATGTLAMSPAGHAEWQRCGSSWPSMWTAMAARVSKRGFAGAMQEWLEPHAMEWSAFGRSRYQMLLAALHEIDRQGIISAAEAARWLRELEVAQSPGKAVVQVMTIHKSKGLGFDLVVLAEVSDEKIPNATHYDMARHDNWVLDPPAGWVRSLVPELADGEEAWGMRQQYEAMCLLYVALTRAKRGLYVLLDEAKNPSDKPSLACWVRRSLESPQQEDGVLFQCGSGQWPEQFPLLAPASDFGARD